MVERCANYFNAFVEVAETVNSNLRCSQVLSAVLESTARAMGAKACSIRLLSDLGRTLELKASYGLSEQYLAKGEVVVGRSLLDADALEGRAVVIDDVASDPRIQYPGEAKAEGICSMLVVPFTLKGMVIGVMRVYMDEPHRFSDDEVEFFRAVANIGAIAYDNARRFEEMESQFETMRRSKVPWAGRF